MLQRIDAARVEPDRHGALVGRAIELGSRLVWTLAAAAWLVGTVASWTGLVGPIATTAWLVRPIAARSLAAGALARLPVAATLRWSVGSVSVRSIRSAVGTASVEAHRRER
jgi:hypothetical protein